MVKTREILNCVLHCVLLIPSHSSLLLQCGVQNKHHLAFEHVQSVDIQMLVYIKSPLTNGGSTKEAIYSYFIGLQIVSEIHFIIILRFPTGTEHQYLTGVNNYTCSLISIFPP